MLSCRQQQKESDGRETSVRDEKIPNGSLPVEEKIETKSGWTMCLNIITIILTSVAIGNDDEGFRYIPILIHGPGGAASAACFDITLLSYTCSHALYFNLDQFYI